MVNNIFLPIILIGTPVMGLWRLMPMLLPAQWINFPIKCPKHWRPIPLLLALAAAAFLAVAAAVVAADAPKVVAVVAAADAPLPAHAVTKKF